MSARGSDCLHDLLELSTRRRDARSRSRGGCVAASREHEEDVERAERDGRHRQKVDRERSGEIRAHEGGPRHRRRRPQSSRRLRHVLRDVSLQTWWPSFASSSAMRRRLHVGLSRAMHEQLDHLGRQRWTYAAPRSVRPEPRESATVLGDHRCRLHDREYVRPARPNA